MIREHKKIVDPKILKARIKKHLKATPTARTKVKARAVRTPESFESQEATIQALIEAYGGRMPLQLLCLKLDKKTSVTREEISKWRSQGFVSLYSVFPVSRMLGITPFALNYHQVAEILGIAPTWKEALESLDGFLHPYEIKKIMALKGPKLPKKVTITPLKSITI